MPSRFQSNLWQNKRVQQHLDAAAQPDSHACGHSLFFRCRKFLNLQRMSSQVLVPNTFSLSGEHLDRLRQALKVAGHQARVAQTGGYGRHLEDALVEIEEAISDHLARIENAVADDEAEAEESGEAERVRRAYFARHETV
jgi:hypothetical protein